MPVWILFVIAFFILTLALVFWVALKQFRRQKLGSADRNYIKKHWGNVMKVASFNPAKSVLDADKILDYALGKHGFTGNLGEKLKKAGPRFTDLNAVWSAHKLRNHIAHELSEITMKQAKSALNSFKKGLNDLGAGLQ